MPALAAVSRRGRVAGRPAGARCRTPGHVARTGGPRLRRAAHSPGRGSRRGAHGETVRTRHLPKRADWGRPTCSQRISGTVTAHLGRAEGMVTRRAECGSKLLVAPPLGTRQVALAPPSNRKRFGPNASLVRIRPGGRHRSRTAASRERAGRSRAKRRGSLSDAPAARAAAPAHNAAASGARPTVPRTSSAAPGRFSWTSRTTGVGPPA